MKRPFMLLLSLALLLIASVAWGEPVRNLISVTKVIPKMTCTLNSSGLCEGQFSLWTAQTGGSEVWREGADIPNPKKAGFIITHSLGSVNPLDDLNFSEQLWVQYEVSVGGVFRIIGQREPLAGAPYSLLGGGGEPGPIGPAGPKGDRGEKGDPGATGPQGPRGLPGGSDSNGTGGNTVMNGSGNPVDTGAAGAIGDFYIDTANSKIYGPKTGADWSGIVGVSLVGPQGLQGLQGPAGLNGAQGAQGPQGQQGVAGPAGPQGPMGPTGTADTTAPVPGNSGTITATNSGLDIALSWTAANDNVTPQRTLEYTVVYSRSNNINTVANGEANGTVVGLPWSSNITSKTVTGLTVGTTYYFNVVVKDAGLNKAVYRTVSKASAVPTTDIILFSQGTPYNGNLGGRSGANTKCSASANKPAGYSNFAAFLSVDATDTISGREAFSGLNTSRNIRSTNGTLIALTWADLLDGTIAASLGAAGVISTSGYWNSGSNVNGTLGETCNGWTVGASGTGALVDWGSGDSTSATWINNNPDTDYCGDAASDLLCIAW